MGIDPRDVRGDPEADVRREEPEDLGDEVLRERSQDERDLSEADREGAPAGAFSAPAEGEVGDVVQAEEPDTTGEAYFPPTDPVVSTDRNGRPEILGGFAETSMDAPVGGSVTRGPGDEALADAVRRELSEDAATADLRIDVEVRERVAFLRGRVPEMTDTDSAAEVAGRIGEIVEVVDQLEVEADGGR